MEEFNAVFLILGHPMMWPNTGLIELPVGLGFWPSIAPLPEHATMRAVNRATDKKRRKKKDEEKVKQLPKLDRRRR